MVYAPESSTTHLTYWLLAAIFLMLGITGVLNHEIWLDEAHHWLIARDSTSLEDLWINMRYEGHPILWDLILVLITRFSTNVMYMQLSHVLIAWAAVCVFLFYSPFRLFEKLLFISGYFVLYEYTVISRNYSLLILVLFISLVLYERKKYVPLGFSLAVLANTHFFGILFASSLLLQATVELWAEQHNSRSAILWIAGLIFLSGVAFSLWQVIPPGDSTLLPNAQLRPPAERMGRTSAVFLKALVPIPDFTSHRYWNSNLLMAVSKPLCALLSVVIFFLPALLFRDRLSLVVFFYSSALGLIAFFFFSDLNAVRYYGGAYMLFVVCMWLHPSTPLNAIFPGKRNRRLIDHRRFFAALLFIQAFAGISAYALDIIRPFSGSREAAQLMLSEKGIQEYISGGCGAAPVSAYLRQKIFYLNQQEYGSYCYLNKDFENPITTTTMLKQLALKHVAETRIVSFLIAHRPIEIHPGEQHLIRPHGQPVMSALRNEQYHIYILSPPNSQ